MSIREQIVHDRTLLGAADSYLKELVHVRPFLFSRYERVLMAVVEQWLAEGGENALDAPSAQWLAPLQDQAADPELTRIVLNDFYQWAVKNELLTDNPLTMHTPI